MSDKRKILMVDDDPIFCELTQAVLEKIGYDSFAVGDAEKARTVFVDDPQQFDLIILDHILSGVLAEELAADFLHLRPDIPIALYTGAVVSLEKLRSKGIRAVINKPLTKNELAAAIASVLKNVS
jgi:CheY-like chemotaxis protein